MRPLPLKLAPGDDLRQTLEGLAQQQGISGFVLGVVGNLSKGRLARLSLDDLIDSAMEGLLCEQLTENT